MTVQNSAMTNAKRLTMSRFCYVEKFRAVGITKPIAEIFEDDLETSSTDTSIELHVAVLKFKHSLKKHNKLEKSAP